MFVVPFATNGHVRNPPVRFIPCKNAFSFRKGTDSMAVVVAHPMATEG